MAFDEIIQNNKTLFSNFNNAKFARFQALIPTTTAKKVVNAIPMLLSLNLKKIPGFIDGEVNFGIVGYQPDLETINYIKGRFNISHIELNPNNNYIEMLAIMGSIGTIAYTKKSDFDYWVCINKNSISSKALNNFYKKVEAIQEWAMKEMKLELHLFVNDIESIKHNIFAEDDEEAFGSTVGEVLKDEFFRSSIIIAGKIPFWWVLPKFATDSEYNKLFDKLSTEQQQNDFIDIGNLYSISKEEFLGAALFQLIKSLGNPFKSIIKMGVLEKYILSTGNVTLLSQKLKSKILRGQLSNNILDSYILMFNEVYEFHQKYTKDPEILHVLRLNLFLKIDPQLSKYESMKDSSSLPYKVKIMFNYVKEWNWTKEQITDYDNFANWNYNKVIAFWNQVKKFMLLSYQKIVAQIPNLNIQNKVSENDFKLLTREIKSHFNTSHEKIENFITFKETPYESILYIEPVKEGIKSIEWLLNRRNKSNNATFESTTLKKEISLIKLISWAAINEIYNSTFTRIKIQSGYSRINQNFISNLMSNIFDQFTTSNTKTKTSYFLGNEFSLTNMIILNFNIENGSEIKTIHHLYKTSWGESFLKEYTNPNALIEILSKVILDFKYSNLNIDDYCTIVSPEPLKNLYKNISKTFKNSLLKVKEIEQLDNYKIIMQLDKNYLLIIKKENKIIFKSFENIVNLLSTLTLTPTLNNKIEFIGEDLRINILKLIYENRVIKGTSIFYEIIGKLAVIYLINESGNLFSYLKPAINISYNLISLYKFAKNINEHIENYNFLPTIDKSIQLFSIEIDRLNNPILKDKTREIEKQTYMQTNFINASITDDANGNYLYCFCGTEKDGFLPLSKLNDEIKLLKNNKNNILLIDNLKPHKISQEKLKQGSTLFYIEKYRLEFLIDKTIK